MHPDGSEAPRTSSKFNSPDFDVIIESSDNVQFRLHRKNLETHTEAFPASDLGLEHSKSDVVKLTETAEVLELLFQFVYPRRPPALSSLDAETLLALAEAVQKYQVFSAMYACEIELRKHVEKHPMLVMLHALRHYTSYEDKDLVNECARLLVRKGQTVTLVRRFAEAGLNTSFIIRWVEYESMWENIFKTLNSKICQLHPNSHCISEKNICIACRNCMIYWSDSLRVIDNTPALQDALDHPKFLEQHCNYGHCRNCNWNQCTYLKHFAKIGSDLFKSIPDFTTLVGKIHQHSED